jgi:alkaline phosphatase D
MTIRFPGRLDVDGFTTVNRRRLLQTLAASGVVTGTGGLFARPVWGSPVFAAYPFSLGVASGDPAPDSFVIWTKIAPKPLERGGGMPRRPVEVEWTVAGDERMRQAVRKGTTIAHPELGHAVHVEVDGLEPARDYQQRLQGVGPAATLREVLQQPARLCPQRGDARALAGGFPGARQGQRTRWPSFDAQELCRRKRQERAGGRLVEWI